MKHYKIKNQTGLSLVEVMVALIITGILTTAIFKLYITQHKNYLTQEDITDIQQSARSSIDQISRNVRMAGYELPLGIAAIEGYDTNPDTIILTYHTSECETFLSAPMPQPSAELKCGSDVSCFFDDQWVYIFDADSAKGEWFQITHVQHSSTMLQHNTMNLSRAYGANSLILAITNVRFYIDNTTDPDHPKLMIQVMGDPPQVYADNITDLQFQYVMKNGAVLDVPNVPENIREVKIELTGRSNIPELDDSGVEHFRNRTFNTSVFLRNVGI